MRTLRLFFSVFLFLAISLWFSSDKLFAMPQGMTESWIRNLADLANRTKHIPYLRGGRTERALDCSGYLWLAGMWAGLPGIQRTRAIRMAQGKDGWDSEVVSLDNDMKEIQAGDTLFWSFESLYDHTGVAMVPGIVDASPTVGVTHRALRGTLITKLRLARRLTIGDRK